MKKCGSCNSEVREDLVICPVCDAILDMGAVTSKPPSEVPSPNQPPPKKKPSATANVPIVKKTVGMKETPKESPKPKEAPYLRNRDQNPEWLWQNTSGIAVISILFLGFLCNFPTWFFHQTENFEISGLNYGGWFFLIFELCFVFADVLHYYWDKYVLYQFQIRLGCLAFLILLYFYYFIAIKTGTILDTEIISPEIYQSLHHSKFFKLKFLFLFGATAFYFLKFRPRKERIAN